jgi:diguanylate cyclase (GGDEF)-like protein
MRSLDAIPMAQVDAFAAGVYLLSGVIHLDLWMHRPERRSHLWLMLASLGALAVDLTGMALRLSDDGIMVLATINLAGVALVTVSIVELVSSLVGRRTSPAARVAEIAMFAFALAATALPFLTELLFVGTFVLLSWAVARAWRAGREDSELRTVAHGLLVLITTLLLDVVMELGFVTKVPGLPVVGFTFLFIATARSLNERFEREHRELEELRLDLEERVRSRTTELEDANQRLAEASRTDALTQLLNRRGFLDFAERELVRSKRSQLPCSIAVLDVDRFKRINDRYGHATGDAVLQTVARILRKSVREQDVIGRWGGEEFILLFPETTADGALHAAEGVRRAIESTSVAGEGGDLFVTVSIGVAGHRAGDALEQTVGAADRALYVAKEQGRNRVTAA